MKTLGFATDSPSRLPEVADIPAALEREGMYCYHRAAYREALQYLSRAADSWLEQGELARWIEVSTYILRILAEHSRFDEISELETRILRTIATHEIPKAVQSRTHYVLGLCNSFRRETLVTANDHMRMAIDLALIAEDRRALAYPILGLANLAWFQERYKETEAELDKLDLILSSVDVPELQSSALMLRGLLHRNLGQYDQALDRLWDAYRTLRKHANLVLYIQVLHSLGTVYSRKSDQGSARHYFELARQAVDEAELPRFKKLIESSLENNRRSDSKWAYDFRFDVERGVIFDRNDRAIHLEGRFVLRDLALLLMRVPGKVCTKEEIVRTVWDEAYDPSAHDNKIYVTIKRLREMLEPRGTSRPSSFVMRVKHGYCFDPAAKVLIY